MIRKDQYKYIFLSNGGRRQLFDLAADPHEFRNIVDEQPALARELHALGAAYARKPGFLPAFDKDNFKVFPFAEIPRSRVNQMAHDRGINGFSFLP